LIIFSEYSDIISDDFRISLVISSRVAVLAWRDDFRTSLVISPRVAVLAWGEAEDILNSSHPASTFGLGSPAEFLMQLGLFLY
jgi:hypothetical protein